METGFQTVPSVHSYFYPNTFGLPLKATNFQTQDQSPKLTYNQQQQLDEQFVFPPILEKKKQQQCTSLPVFSQVTSGLPIHTVPLSNKAKTLSNNHNYQNETVSCFNDSSFYGSSPSTSAWDKADNLDWLEREACALLSSLASRCNKAASSSSSSSPVSSPSASAVSPVSSPSVSNSSSSSPSSSSSSSAFSSPSTKSTNSSPISSQSKTLLKPTHKIQKKLQKKKNVEKKTKLSNSHKLSNQKPSIRVQLAVQDPIGQKVIVKDFVTEGELLSVCPFTIKCGCCSSIFTPSNFEKHVGSTAHRPYECILLVGVAGRDGGLATLRDLKTQLESNH